MRFTWVVAAAWGLGGSSIAQTSRVEWPQVTNEAKPWTRWWWMGSAVDEKGLSAAMEAYRKAGLGGVEVTPIYGVRGEESRFIEYLSSDWVGKFMYTLKEADRLGLGVDLANASGWPFGGPWIDESTASKNFVSRTYTLQGGQRLQETVSYEQKPMARMQSRKKVDVSDLKYPLSANQPTQEFAFAQVRYQKMLPLVCLTAHKKVGDTFVKTVELTDKVHEGRLDWTAPEGEWVLCALFMGDHGKMVERAGLGGEGWVIDHFSEEALRTYLKKFDEAFAGRDLSGLRYYFNDSYEVDDASGQSNWTPEFFAEFKRLQGYDLQPYIPALLGLDKPGLNTRVLYDYRMTISHLLLERYTKGWEKWAANQGKGIRNQAHGSPANLLDLYAASDVPEVEGAKFTNLKFASSASHVTGKKLTSSETCTWLNDHFLSTLGDAKTNMDKYLLAGVNHMFYHGTTYSPQDAPWPGWLFYAAVHFTPANSFWEDFDALNRYVARAQSFLQAGRPANDVLLYFSIADRWSEPVVKGRLLDHFHTDKFMEGMSMDECAAFLTDKGFAWDAISDRQLHDVASKGDRLVSGGNLYRTIVVPATTLIPAETFARLMALVESGATVLFHRHLPSDVPGLSKLDESRKQLKELTSKLSFVNQGGAEVASYGKGKVVLSSELATLMAMAQVAPEPMVAQGLQCIRRVKTDGHSYYFVKNPRRETFQGWVTLGEACTSAALYNPMTGLSGVAKTREKDGKTEVYMQFAPDESFVVETFGDKCQGKPYVFYRPSGKEQVPDGEWKLTFVKGGPDLPAPLTTPVLKSWTEWGTDYERFSGTAEYVMTLPKLPSAEAWRLCIDEVHESASVFVNGQYVGSLLNAPYTLDIPASMLKGQDELKIRVSNLMANRIIDLDKRGVVWRKFYNTNFNAIQKENVGKDGCFTTLGWTPKVSGLCGRVTLIPLSPVE